MGQIVNERMSDFRNSVRMTDFNLPQPTPSRTLSSTPARPNPTSSTSVQLNAQPCHPQQSNLQSHHVPQTMGNETSIEVAASSSSNVGSVAVASQTTPSSGDSFLPITPSAPVDSVTDISSKENSPSITQQPDNVSCPPIVVLSSATFPSSSLTEVVSASVQLTPSELDEILQQEEENMKRRLLQGDVETREKEQGREEELERKSTQNMSAETQAEVASAATCPPLPPRDPISHSAPVVENESKSEQGDGYDISNKVEKKATIDQPPTLPERKETEDELKPPEWKKRRRDGLNKSNENKKRSEETRKTRPSDGSMINPNGR